MKIASILLNIWVAPILLNASLSAAHSHVPFEIADREALRKPPKISIPPHEPAHHTAHRAHPSSPPQHKGSPAHSKATVAHEHGKHSTDSHHTGTKDVSSHNAHTKTSSHSTTSTHGPSKNMIIFGKEGISDAAFKGAIKDIRRKVKVLVQKPELDLQMAGAYLTPQEVLELKKNRNIEAVEEDVQKGKLKGIPNDTGKPHESSDSKDGKGKKNQPISKRQYKTQSKVADLGLLSQAPGHENKGDYYYHESAGEGIAIYVIDSGLNTEHPEFADLERVRWLFPTPELTTTKKDDPLGHGTCVAAKALGKKSGVAKKASLVVVKNADPGTYAETIAEWAYVFADASLSNLAERSVVNYSTVLEAVPGGHTMKRFKKLVKKLVSIGVIVVVSAGNGGGAINTYPALFARELPIIVVGASDTRGRALSFSQTGKEVAVSATGQVDCAAPIGSGYRFDRGTSFAAPQVAGLVAYLLAHPDTKEHFASLQGAARSVDMLALIKGLAYPRHEGGPLVAYNGIGSSMKCHMGAKDDACPAYVTALAEPSLIHSLAAVSGTTMAVRTKTAEHHTGSASTAGAGSR